jgi:hypothetical protein
VGIVEEDIVEVDIAVVGIVDHIVVVEDIVVLIL